jgi:purine-binding chemotaxis protein CheW
MAVGLEQRSEACGLPVDAVGEALKLDPEALQPNPVHMDPRWANLPQGVHQLRDMLPIILDVDQVIAFKTRKPRGPVEELRP